MEIHPYDLWKNYTLIIDRAKEASIIGLMRNFRRIGL